MSEEKFDVIIVGGGLAGSTAACVLAQAGVEVLVVERGETCGAKNMTGGRLYGHSLEKVIPDFASRAPVERRITKERVSLLTQEAATTVEFQSAALGAPGAASYSVLRSRFDKWLAEEAEDRGAMYVTGIRVDDLLVRDGKVRGVRAGDEEMEADTVILADGVNSLLAQKLGMKRELDPIEVAVGAKEVITLGEDTIRDRFGLDGMDGLAWMFVGAPTGGSIGGGFLYTNRDSVSLGIVTTVGDIDYSGLSVTEMVERFKELPAVRPLIAGGTLSEYSAHLVPEGGYRRVPKLYGDGVLLAGDAAGLVINLGYMVRGMDLAIESGRLAANAVLYARRQGDFSARTLSAYQTALENSFVFQDLKQHQDAPKVMENRRMFTTYPKVLGEAAKALFLVDGTPSKGLIHKLLPLAEEIDLTALGLDGLTAIRAL